MATTEEMHAALALLCAVDAEAFEAALPAVPPDPGVEAASRAGRIRTGDLRDPNAAR
jgi:hypothetical protein